MPDEQEPKTRKIEPKDEKPEEETPEEVTAEERSDGLAGYPKTETHQTFRDA